MTSLDMNVPESELELPIFGLSRKEEVTVRSVWKVYLSPPLFFDKYCAPPLAQSPGVPNATPPGGGDRTFFCTTA